jgi:hypothetical protein
MKRRDFLKTGSFGLAGLTLAGSDLQWLMNDAAAASNVSGSAWKFGVMADSQWATKTDPTNPGTCAVNIISAINQQFINAGVSFVVQVGDLVDSESWTSLSTGLSERTLKYRAAAAQSLYDAGIGFFPLRGNHEASQTAAGELPTLFPQTLGTSNTFGASIIPSDNSQLLGLSYAFDFNNVRIVLLDQFTRKDGTTYNGTNTGDNNSGMLDQLSWVDGTLSGRTAGTHAFVLGHKNLIGQDHVDVLFGANPSKNPTQRNQFITSLENNNVGYYLGGHDHMHHRSIVKSPDGSASVEQIICSSNSYKFYTPASTSNDKTYDQAVYPTTYPLEKVVTEELYTIGYYIFTVEGPCVTVDFYSSSKGAAYGSGDLAYPPGSYNFYLRERFGYSLNGKEFVIAQGEAYTTVKDSYNGFTAKVLAGSNAASSTDLAGRAMNKTVKTGWRDQPTGAASPILKLWGMDNNLSLWAASSTSLPDSDDDQVSDVFALSLSYNPKLVSLSSVGSGAFHLRAKDGNGNWVSAVSLNEGGSAKFVYGPWKSSYSLGTYGVDPTTHTVWAVIDRDGEFVAA